MVRHCAICGQVFPAEMYGNRRAARVALAGHIFRSHPEYDIWTRKWTRILAVFPVMIVIDIIAFTANAITQRIAGPLLLLILMSVAGPEIIGEGWLARTTYHRGLAGLRLAWQEKHPDGFVQQPEQSTTPASGMDNQGPEERGILDVARELCRELNITKFQLNRLAWVGRYLHAGRGAMVLRPDMCYFRPITIMVSEVLRGKLNQDEWRPLIASSLVFDLKQRKLVGRLIAQIIVIVLGVLVLVPLGLFLLGVPGLVFVIPLGLVSYLIGRRTRGKVLLESDYEAEALSGTHCFLRL